MKKGDCVFVYGTLRKGERADLSKHQGKFCVSYLGLDEINGKLYHLAAFPGLKLLPSSQEEFNPKLPVVTGEVFLVLDPSIGAMLDAYEGVNHDDPEKGLYRREVVVTRRDRLVWTYVYNDPFVTEDQFIETGDWKNPRLQLTMRTPIITVGKGNK